MNTLALNSVPLMKQMQRHPVEVIVALLHQAKDNRVNLKPFAYREGLNDEEKTVD